MNNGAPQQRGELFEFMMNKLGGKDAVMLEFYRERINALGVEENTVATLLDEAENQGWNDWLRSMKLPDLASIINPLLVNDLASTLSEGQDSRRMTGAEKAALYSNICVFLEENPWKSAAEIAEMVDVPKKKLGIHLKRMKDLGEIKSVGVKAKMRYAVKGEGIIRRDE